MIIAKVCEKCKAFLAKIPRDVLPVVILILSVSASFGLGYLAGKDAGKERENLIITDLSSETIAAQAFDAGNGKFVASKNGTKYYPSNCTGAERIAEGNKVWFASVIEAEAAGYTPAANCKFDITP